MNHRFLRFGFRVAAALAVLGAAVGSTSPTGFAGVVDGSPQRRVEGAPSASKGGEEAQTPAAAPKPWNPPRTPDGQPDIQGYWAYRGPRMATYSIERGANEEHLRLTGLGSDHISVIVDPPDGKVPYQPWAAAKRKEVEDNYQEPKPEHVDPQAKCWLLGVRLNYQSQFRILQTPGYVVILYEFTHAYRIIPLAGAPHIGETIKLFMGDSRGHWEGNTLVVDLTNNNDKTWFDIVGDFHSDALHVVERWTFVDADTIQYEARIDDPKVYTRPWTMAFPFGRNKEPGYELLEMACYEGERSVAGMLRRNAR